MNWTYAGWWWMPMVFMGIMFLLMVVGCVVMMVRMRRGHGTMSGMTCACGGNGALDILRTRFARGELSKGDFDRMRQELG